MADEKQTCFVLMPFEAPRDKYYAQIYSRAIDDAGLTPKRGDSLFRSSPIMGDIWKFVQESTVLLADLTGRNANVFYELGLAHAISKPVVLVAETMDDVPFDLRGLRVLTFDRNDPDWGSTLRERVASALKETLADVLGAVPSMFIRTTQQPTVSAGESALELQVRALAEEITALRRETIQPTVRPMQNPPAWEVEDAVEDLLALLRRNVHPEAIVTATDMGLVIEIPGLARKLWRMDQYPDTVGNIMKFYLAESAAKLPKNIDPDQ